MKKVKGILVVLVGISLMMVGLSYAQPKIPKSSIPSTIPPELREQIERLYSQDPVERGYAAYELGKMGAEAAPAVPFLIGILGGDEEKEAVEKPTSPGREAAGALAKIGKPSVGPLIAALKDKDSYVRGNAAWALGLIKDSLAVGPLIAALKDEDEKVRLGAAWALGEIKDNRSVKPLIVALKNKDSDTRHNAALALGKIGDSRAVDPLIAALKDENSDVRESAVAALWYIGESAVDPLIAALKDKDSNVRANAARALGDIKDTRAVGPLIAALNDENSDVREFAALALEIITEQGFGEDPIKWQRWWEKNKAK